MKLKEALRERKTQKIRGDIENPLLFEDDEMYWQRVHHCIELAGTAPFHLPLAPHHLENELKGIEPWRMYVLKTATCRKLLDDLKTDHPVKASEGLLQMLAATRALIITTWLPEEKKGNALFDPTIKNMEHIAAASAAIQNFLLAATAEGINNYWSSGGTLRKEKALEYMDIPTDQILLGALFLFPSDNLENAKPGKNRALKSEPSAWSKEVMLS